MRDVLHNREVVVHVLRIERDLVRVWLTLVDAVAWVLHSQHVNLQHVLDEGEKLHGEPDILSISMKVDQKFGTSTKVWQVQAWNDLITCNVAAIALRGLIYSGYFPLVLIDFLQVFLE